MKRLKHTIKNIFVLAIVCFGFNQAASAQCNASFTYSIGSAGQVTFTNTSSMPPSGYIVYNWSFDYQSNYSNNVSPTFTYPFNGSYNVMLTAMDSLGSCYDVDTQTVVITNSGTLLPCDAAYNYSVDSNNTVTFTNVSAVDPSSATSYYWDFGDWNYSGLMSPTHTYIYNGTYTVILYINNTTANCFDTEVHTVVITNALPIPTCTASFTDSIIGIGEVFFSPNYQGVPTPSTYYFWDFGAVVWNSNGSYWSTTSMEQYPTVTYPYNGAYNVTLTIMDSVTSCMATYSDSIFITNSIDDTCTATCDFYMVPDSMSVGVWNIIPNYSSQVTWAQWSWGDGSITTGLYPSHTFANAATYHICVIVGTACGDSASFCLIDSIFKTGDRTIVQVNVINPAIISGVENIKEEAVLNLYPNPSNGLFTLAMEDIMGSASNTEIKVVDCLGQTVYHSSETVSKGKIHKEIDLTAIAKGIYFLQVNTGHSMYSLKTVINK